MEYSTLKPWQEIGETGIVHDQDSFYGRFHHLSDPRGAKGKQYSLVPLLSVIFLAKLAGKDKPDEIADWAKNHAGELAGLLGLKRQQMPSHSTIRRVFHTILEADVNFRPIISHMFSPKVYHPFSPKCYQ